jgi:apolipoprotein N-acyltransferase
MNRIVVLLVAAGLLAGLQSQNQRRWTEDSGRDFNIGLVQGAIPQELKWRAEQLQPTLDLYLQLSLQMQNRDLIVWPEAAIPALPFEVSDYAAAVNEVMSERGTQLFTGILNYDLERGEYANTLWALGAEQGLYKKRHLVMFGEYFPLPGFARRWLRVMNLPSENIAPGPRDQPPLMANGVAIAATICWELAFGAEQLDFLPQAGLLVNVSNDAWFGDTIMPHQHLQIGQMRARESGRFLLRSTNTGITAVVDPLGRVTHRIPQFEAGVLEATVKPHLGATPYVRAGNWPVISLVFLLLLASAVRARAGVS